MLNPSSLGLRSGRGSPGNGIIVLTAREDGSCCAFMVDQIIDQRQVVVKPLNSGFGQIPGLAAATILGQGEIALILDTNELAQKPRARRIPALAIAG